MTLPNPNPNPNRNPIPDPDPNPNPKLNPDPKATYALLECDSDWGDLISDPPLLELEVD